MVPGLLSSAFCMPLDRTLTSSKPVIKSNALARDKAEYSPKLCPATQEGITPSSFSNSPIITLTI